MVLYITYSCASIVSPKIWNRRHLCSGSLLLFSSQLVFYSTEKSLAQNQTVQIHKKPNIKNRLIKTIPNIYKHRSLPCFHDFNTTANLYLRD